MTNFLGTGIFWTTIAAVVAVLALSTLLGRAWVCLLPYRFRATAKFYLAPTLGLSSLTIIASALGRHLPLGNTVVVPLLVSVLLIFAMVREQHIKQALCHALTVSAFGVFCGISVLAPLYAYGAFNAHNDAFTYLAHSSWLQTHAFGETISAEKVTPLTTQILLYQHAGLRMGGSFLLALVQALLNLRWAYQVYPTVIIAGIATCCISLGFPLARALRPAPRLIRLMLLAIPAFSFGGLIFGANLGFLPQTIGLALGAAFLFLAGSLFYWIATTKPSGGINAKASLNIALLFVGAALAYAELAPLLLLAVSISALVLAIRLRAWSNLILQGIVLLVIVAALLNTELVRAYTAIKMQSGVVVGSPVDWTLLGFVAHAFGVHGGAWDGFQWTSLGSRASSSYALGTFLFVLVLAVTAIGLRAATKEKTGRGLLPSGVAILAFGLGVIYYRYFVASPFPVGAGQSWSQFKLADWAHPFVMVFFLFALASLRNRSKKQFDRTLMAFFVSGLVGAGAIGIDRTSSLMNYYRGVSDLDQFYRQFRDGVLANCPATMPIYLALGGENHKFRQMALLYLYDRDVASDWTDDGYIYARLPEGRRTQELMLGNCVIESNIKDGWLAQGTEIGIVRMGWFNGPGQVRIASVSGGYDRESDGKNWWHWITHKISFKLQPMFITKDASRTKLRFEYATRGEQTLSLRIVKADGTIREFTLQSKDAVLEIFDQVIDISPNELASMEIETDGTATVLGGGDTRMAAWIVRNVTITPASP